MSLGDFILKQIILLGCGFGIGVIIAVAGSSINKGRRRNKL